MVDDSDGDETLHGPCGNQHVDIDDKPWEYLIGKPTVKVFLPTLGDPKELFLGNNERCHQPDDNYPPQNCGKGISRCLLEVTLPSS